MSIGLKIMNDMLAQPLAAVSDMQSTGSSSLLTMIAGKPPDVTEKPPYRLVAALQNWIKEEEA